MKSNMKYRLKYFSTALCLFMVFNVAAQISPGIYLAEENVDQQTVQHKLTISDTYFIHNEYQQNPAKFIRTWGGFYTISKDSINVRLEFDSQYDIYSKSEENISYKLEGNKLMVGDPSLTYFKQNKSNQELDGFWLFATRGPDTGQERRGDENPRKTLKVLLDGSFQWIAYNTESFKFFGTGGGSYKAENGTYTESIEFFSRDNSRVGADLQFTYKLEGDDWHHTGKNSRGEPLYEIWSKR